MHYTEAEFGEGHAGSTIEALISFNNQLQQQDAAKGILKAAEGAQWLRGANAATDGAEASYSASRTKESDLLGDELVGTAQVGKHFVDLGESTDTHRPRAGPETSPRPWEAQVDTMPWWGPSAAQMWPTTAAWMASLRLSGSNFRNPILPS